jgi:endo-1,4-beta-xylanase
MVRLLSCFNIAAASITLAIPLNGPSQNSTILPRSGTPSESGTDGSFSYYYSTDGSSNAYYDYLGNGTFNITWSGNGDLSGRVGWQDKDFPRVISYKADYKSTGESYLTVYGWTASPYIQYYIVESWGGYDPNAQSKPLGTLHSDGSDYTIYNTVITGPTIGGGSSIPLSEIYWSFRQDKRTSGNVTTANHFNGWSNVGLNMGKPFLQAIAVEAVSGNGTATVTLL